MTTGLVFSGLMLVAGSIMIFIQDSAEVIVTPGVAALQTPRRLVGSEMDGLRGLTVEARF